MRKTLTCTALIVGLCAAASAQVIKVEPHAYASDVWGKYYNSGKQVTLSGRVTGIEITKTVSGGDNEVTLLVFNKENGGTAVVDVGPQWYVNHQVAKIRMKDKVQVTGSKVLVDGHGIVLAKMIRVNGQGGLVVSLRRPNGHAYWMGVETDPSIVVPTGPNVITGTISRFGTYNQADGTYGDAFITTPNGELTIDLGPQWYYNMQNAPLNVGDNVSVMTGGQPFTIGYGGKVYQSQSIYQGSNVYTIRTSNGTPVYNWGN